MALLEKMFNRLGHLLLRGAQLTRVLFYWCISTNSVTGKPSRHQPLQRVGAGEIHMDNDVGIGFFPSPFFLSTYAYLEARNPSAIIRIGSGTWLNNNFCAIAEHTSISIGRNCLIGANVELLDSDFHGLAVKDRCKSLPEWAKPIVICNNVFIGSNVKVLKGVTIWDGSIIANGSVVTTYVPSGVIAGGNPAMVIRAIDPNG